MGDKVRHLVRNSMPRGRVYVIPGQGQGKRYEALQRILAIVRDDSGRRRRLSARRRSFDGFLIARIRGGGNPSLRRCRVG